MSTRLLTDAEILVNKQAEDEGLWFVAQTAPEGYLQQSLRELHAVVEADAKTAAAMQVESDQRYENIVAIGDDIALELDALRARGQALADALDAIQSEIWHECKCNEAYTGRKLIDPSCQYHDFIHVLPAATAALEAWNAT